MNRALCAAVLSGLAALGCAEGASDRTEVPGALPTTVRLIPDTLASAPVFSLLAHVALARNTLWVSDRDGNPALHAIDAATGAVLRSVGRPGQGPGDVPDVANLSVDIDDSSAVWVTGTNRRITRVTDSTYVPNASAQPTVVSFAQAGDLWVHAVAKRRFMGIAFRDSATLVMLDTAGHVLSTADIPFPGSEDISKRERRRAMQGATLCVGKQGTLLALTYHKQARIDFYSVSGTRLGGVDVPFPYDARFDSAAGARPDGALARFAPEPGSKVFVEDRWNYAACAFSEQYLFALYSGSSSAERGQTSRTCCGTFVHVFDLEGQLVQILELGVTVTSIAVSPNSRRIFASSAWGQSLVYGFDVPPLAGR